MPWGHYRKCSPAQTLQKFIWCTLFIIWSSIVTGDGWWRKSGTQDIFIKRLKVVKSSSGVSCAYLSCITDNYPVIYNQSVFVHWGKNRNGYFTEYMDITYSLEKVISELFKSYDSLLQRNYPGVYHPPDQTVDWTVQQRLKLTQTKAKQYRKIIKLDFFRATLQFWFSLKFSSSFSSESFTMVCCFFTALVLQSGWCMYMRACLFTIFLFRVTLMIVIHHIHSVSDGCWLVANNHWSTEGRGCTSRCFLNHWILVHSMVVLKKICWSCLVWSLP